MVYSSAKFIFLLKSRVSHTGTANDHDGQDQASRRGQHSGEDA